MRLLALSLAVIVGSASVLGGVLASPTPQATAQSSYCAVPVEPSVPPAAVDSSQLHALATGEDVTVAVIDTGVAPHPLIRNLVPGADFVTPTNPSPLSDCDGHGTVVAGIIAGEEFGIAPDAAVLSIRQTSGVAASPAEGSSGSLVSLAQALHYSIDAGADVINISVVSCVSREATTLIDDSVLTTAIERAEASNVVVVAAAGNVTQNCPQGSFVYPAHLPTVVAVGARDNDYNVADYSVQLPDTHPALTAPGEPTVALSPDGQGYAAGVSSRGSGTPEPFAGTSFAAPVVSGAAALLKQRYPEESASELRARLYAAAEPASGYLTPEAALTGVQPTGREQEHIVALNPAPRPQDHFTARAGLLVLAGTIGTALALMAAGLRRRTGNQR